MFDFSGKPLAAMAYDMAKEHHAGIFRKGVGQPYITHPEWVCGRVMAAGFIDQETLAAALLHDCAEDKDAGGRRMPIDRIRRVLNARIAQKVTFLTKVKRGTRAETNLQYNKLLASAPTDVKAIKLADILHNLSDIETLDEQFALTYLQEKERQVSAIDDAISPSQSTPRLQELLTDAYLAIDNGALKLHRAMADRVKASQAREELELAEMQAAAARAASDQLASLAMF